MKRLLLPILIAALMLFASTRPQQAPAPDVAEAQENAPYHMSSFVCPGPADCCAVPVPMMTQPAPGGTPTVLAESEFHPAPAGSSSGPAPRSNRRARGTRQQPQHADSDSHSDTTTDPNSI